ncbi:MAG: hypothetical protein FJW31_13470 [Acidobacteria bacterium]|nr:hypothetical protein [Acidobacteriota bacterium]
MIAAARTIGDKVLAAKGVSGAAPIRTSRPRATEPAIPVEMIVFVGFVLLMFYLNSRTASKRRYRRGGGGGVIPIFFPPAFQAIIHAAAVFGG